jgi:hypothetical protein
MDVMITQAEKEKLAEVYKREVYDLLVTADPRSEQQSLVNDTCFKSFVAGWAVGKGLTLLDAYEFSFYIRYKTKLG